MGMGDVGVGEAAAVGSVADTYADGDGRTAGAPRSTGVIIVIVMGNMRLKRSRTVG